MKPDGNVAIFWDLDTCPPDPSLSGYTLVANIRTVAHRFGTVTSFKGYLGFDITSKLAASSRTLDFRAELQTSGVSLSDRPRSSDTIVLTQLLTVDMLTYAYEHIRPGSNEKIMLISGNPLFSYAVSTLRLRKFDVVLLCPSDSHPSLSAQASEVIDWDVEILKRNLDVDANLTSIHPTKPAVSNSLFSFGSAAKPPAAPEVTPTLPESNVADDLLEADASASATTSETALRSTSAQSSGNSTQESPFSFGGNGLPPKPVFRFGPPPQTAYSTLATTSPTQTQPSATTSPSGPPASTSKLNSAAQPFTPSHQPAKSSIPMRWRVLVQVLEEKRKSTGQRQITRFDVGGHMSRYKAKEIYKMAGVTNFGDWIDSAEQDGIIETGGEGTSRWMALRPEWLAVASTTTS